MPRARKYDGVVYRRAGTAIWWIRYRDRSGVARRESSLTADWQEANKKAPRTAAGEGRKSPRRRSKGRDLGFRTMGGFLSGEPFQTARTGCENTRSE